MPQTRGNAKTSADAEHVTETQDKLDLTPIIEKITQNSSAKTKGRRRKSSSADDVAPKKRKSKDNPKPVTRGKKKQLSTPDLEFGYDRSQPRDPRPTQGRQARPRYRDIDIPSDLKAQLGSTRQIPKPEKPAGRLNAFQKDELFIEEGRMNALHTFHHLYRYHDKGREGSPTFDLAGFKLDYEKVAGWMKPQAYNKGKMVRGIERRVEKAQSEEKQIFGLFFESTTKNSEKNSFVAKDYVKDHVSKDLDIPWHQIKPKQVQLWRDKGFRPFKFEEWWKEPTAEKRKRMMNMMGGASLRKDL